MQTIQLIIALLPLVELGIQEAIVLTNDLVAYLSKGNTLATQMQAQAAMEIAASTAALDASKTLQDILDGD
jgi:hypothetical protein